MLGDARFDGEFELFPTWHGETGFDVIGESVGFLWDAEEIFVEFAITVLIDENLDGVVASCDPSEDESGVTIFIEFYGAAKANFVIIFHEFHGITDADVGGAVKARMALKFDDQLVCQRV